MYLLYTPPRAPAPAPGPGVRGLRLQSFATDVDNIKYTTHIYTIHATPKGSWKFEAGAARQPPPLSLIHI